MSKEQTMTQEQLDISSPQETGKPQKAAMPAEPALPEETALPMVSIVVPVRNEEEYIESCLDSIHNQTYDHGRIEVLVVNGCSEDATERLAIEFSHKTDLTIRILQNPAGNTPCGLNTGSRNARGDIVVFFNGHATMAPDFVEKNVQYLQDTSADAVGGLVVSTCKVNKIVPKSIGYALNSLFGLGGVTARTGTKAGYISNPSFGAYRRELFDRFGYIDERLTRNQDYEFNQRISSSGAAIFFSPEIKSLYYNRPTYSSLWREYYKAAKWRAFMIGRFARAVMKRHLVPPMFVLSVLALGALSPFESWAMWALIGVLGLYLMTALVSAVSIGRSKGLKHVPSILLSYIIIHFAFGLGFLFGVLYFVIFRRGKYILGAEAQ